MATAVQQMHPVARYATFSMQVAFSEGELRGSIDYHRTS